MAPKKNPRAKAQEKIAKAQALATAVKEVKR